ncbi:hypothetical protein [Nostoc sp. CHAB 5715]|uniref:hypothetical protein n=1 Tax=Nostoc sp. CHAB 5715 TaxID=2780400 RepID=UPI001E404EC7|nr:hypothetical protein [Nostoc sp. CHAB 5715]MCC5622577.1 hypothetical protein [Nostoc sp. CHAB 5715]
MKLIKSMDVPMGALAQPTVGIPLSRKLVLLTRNHRDLGKVPGLLIEIGRFNAIASPIPCSHSLLLS